MERAVYQFDADVDDYLLRIRSVSESLYLNEPCVVIDIIRRDSNLLIETISNATFRPVQGQISADSISPNQLLAETHRQARIQALRVGDTLDRVLASLLEL